MENSGLADPIYTKKSISGLPPTAKGSAEDFLNLRQEARKKALGEKYKAEADNYRGHQVAESNIDTQSITSLPTSLSKGISEMSKGAFDSNQESLIAKAALKSIQETSMSLSPKNREKFLASLEKKYASAIFKLTTIPHHKLSTEKQIDEELKKALIL